MFALMVVVVWGTFSLFVHARLLKTSTTPSSWISWRASALQCPRFLRCRPGVWLFLQTLLPKEKRRQTTLKKVAKGKFAIVRGKEDDVEAQVLGGPNENPCQEWSLKEAKNQRALAAYVIFRSRRNKSARPALFLHEVLAWPGRRQGHERMEELKKLVNSIRPELRQMGKGLRGSSSTDSLKEEEPSTVDAVLAERSEEDENQAVEDPVRHSELPPPQAASGHSVPKQAEESAELLDPPLDPLQYPDNQLGLEVPEHVVNEMEAHEEQEDIASPAHEVRERQSFKDRAPLFELPDIATLTRDHLQEFFPELSSLESPSYDMVSRLLLEVGSFSYCPLFLAVLHLTHH